MELDDFKEKWKSPDIFDPQSVKKEDLQKKIDTIAKSNGGIRKAFLFEVLFMAITYVGFLLVVIFSSHVQSFIYKLVIVTLLGAVPICYRLYKSQKWLNSIDYAKDIRTNLMAFSVYYKMTLRLYRLISYLVIILLLVLFYTDESFLDLQPWLKISIVSYMFLILLLTGPYINKVYGKRVDSIESFLND